MKFGALPDAVLYALVMSVGNFDMDTTEKMRAAQSLRPRTIDEMPGGVLRQVDEACESVRLARIP